MDLLLDPEDLLPVNSCLVLLLGGHLPRTAVQEVGQGGESSTSVEWRSASTSFLLLDKHNTASAINEEET